jgi:hypothetical protein
VIRRFKFEDEIYESLNCLPMAPQKARRARSEVKPRAMRATRPWRAMMIFLASSASEEERDALRIFIEEATIARTGLPPKTLPDEACRSADPPAHLPELLPRNARAAGIKVDNRAWSATRWG